MKIALRIFVIALIFALSSCATLPPPSEMRTDIENYQLPILPEDGKAIVYIIRPSALGGLVRFNVFVDDKEPESEMGYTRASQYIYFNLSPGDHQILSKAENWAKANITAIAGDIIFIQQEPSMGFIMARNNLTMPQEYEGKYQIKHLSLGTVIKTSK